MLGLYVVERKYSQIALVSEVVICFMTSSVLYRSISDHLNQLCSICSMKWMSTLKEIISLYCWKNYVIQSMNFSVPLAMAVWHSSCIFTLALNSIKTVYLFFLTQTILYTSDANEIENKKNKKFIECHLKILGRTNKRNYELEFDYFSWSIFSSAGITDTAERNFRLLQSLSSTRQTICWWLNYSS